MDTWRGSEKAKCRLSNSVLEAPSDYRLSVTVRVRAAGCHAECEQYIQSVSTDDIADYSGVQQHQELQESWAVSGSCRFENLASPHTAVNSR